ncbi:NAD(P)/FAD-dependent oxidoreductase [Deinococcus taeanensis]|uniref:NAD(P)/FAD-dependent oxidoreductase n=1 Tax=Deinococcus taeanensis TaxID=2737050 RepID=UPI001CDBF330|nr:NAD(P)/FAD-dependent oxidoreductase [Deinococcus taeanensis]UBV41891.1 NAD(P)/FAD-dependent oxidoreductase [Deinococcus taeanensis]
MPPPRAGQVVDGLFDVIVVGAGPAGLSAALTLGRSRRHVLLLDGGPPRNTSVSAGHGLLTRDGISPHDLKKQGLADLEPYDVTVLTETAREVRGAPGLFSVRAGNGWFHARVLLFATGVRDILPAVPGLRERWGQGVYHCPYCDGWEHGGRALAVYGHGQSGHHLALTVRAWSDRVTLLTNGETCLTPAQAQDLERVGVRVQDAPIRHLSGGPLSGQAVCVTFRRRPPLQVDAIFLAPEQEGGSHLPASLGCALNEKGRVLVNEQQETSVPGVYATGDMTGAPQYVVQAAAAGMHAAQVINTRLIHEAVHSLGAAFHKSAVDPAVARDPDPQSE